LTWLKAIYQLHTYAFPVLVERPSDNYQGNKVYFFNTACEAVFLINDVDASPFRSPLNTNKSALNCNYAVAFADSTGEY